ncbi:hypothetical protein [Caballeronia cordobensis]|uniref:hypothetical protein n=1 Tax=Caballeronia cordobensis TaxID=1353886 RepID=UPI00045EF951|nr:hypothetical protein BRPE67_BCDS11440 [Burkholderia sp. RPE67]
MNELYTHQRIEEIHRQTMTEVGSILRDVFKGYGFALLVFDFNVAGRMNYLSNAHRGDMVRALQEFIDLTQREAGSS